MDGAVVTGTCLLGVLRMIYTVYVLVLIGISPGAIGKVERSLFEQMSLVSTCYSLSCFPRDQSCCVEWSVFRAYLRSWPDTWMFILQVAYITQAHCVISGAAGWVNEIVSSATSSGSFLELCFLELGYSTELILCSHTLLLHQNSFPFTENISTITSNYLLCCSFDQNLHRFQVKKKRKKKKTNKICLFMILIPLKSYFKRSTVLLFTE